MMYGNCDGTHESAQRAGFLLSLELESGNLPKQSWVKLSQIRTLSVKRIGDVIDVLLPEVLSRLIDGLNEIISYSRLGVSRPVPACLPYSSFSEPL